MLGWLTMYCTNKKNKGIRNGVRGIGWWRRKRVGGTMGCSPVFELYEKWLRSIKNNKHKEESTKRWADRWVYDRHGANKNEMKKKRRDCRGMALTINWHRPLTLQLHLRTLGPHFLLHPCSWMTDERGPWSVLEARGKQPGHRLEAYESIDVL